MNPVGFGERDAQVITDDGDPAPDAAEGSFDLHLADIRRRLNQQTSRRRKDLPGDWEPVVEIVDPNPKAPRLAVRLRRRPRLDSPDVISEADAEGVDLRAPAWGSPDSAVGSAVTEMSPQPVATPTAPAHPRATLTIPPPRRVYRPSLPTQVPDPDGNVDRMVPDDERVVEAEAQAIRGAEAEERAEQLAAPVAEAGGQAEAAPAADVEHAAKIVRVAEEERAAEAARVAELEKVAEAARVAERDRIAEAAHGAEAEQLAQRVAEAERLSEHLLARVAEAEQAAEEARVAEAARVAELQEVAEAARLAEAERLAQRVAEAERLSEDRLVRVAEAERAAEAARVATTAHAVDAERLAKADRSDETASVEVVERLPDAAQIAEWDRLAAERLAELERAQAKRAAEAERAAHAERVALAKREAKLAPNAELDAESTPAGALSARLREAAAGERTKPAGRAFTRMRGGSAATAATSKPVGYGVAQAEPAVNSADPVKPGKTKARTRRVILVVGVIAIVALLRAFVVSSFDISSPSMQRTLHVCAGCASDVVMIDKVGYRFSDVSRADVVVFDRPGAARTADRELIMRVIGLPGETVSAHSGRVFIGGKGLAEPYLNSICHGTVSFAPVKVPAGQYFMMGDNRCDSLDSRRFGTIAKSRIVGRAFVVVWPTKHWRWL